MGWNDWLGIKLITIPGFLLLLHRLTIQHELHHHVDWFLVSAETQQLDDVFVVKPLHHLCLTQEVKLFFHSGTNLGMQQESHYCTYLVVIYEKRPKLVLSCAFILHMFKKS